MRIRDAEPEDLEAVGDLRITAYRAGDHLPEDDEYEPRLRGLGADGHGEVLVAIGTELVGTVMLQYWPHVGRVVTGPDEAEIRALAVAPGAQGTGIGAALLEAAIERARERGVRHLVLLTLPGMRAAQHLYQRAGFARLADRDWIEDGEIALLAYGLVLAG